MSKRFHRHEELGKMVPKGLRQAKLIMIRNAQPLKEALDLNETGLLWHSKNFNRKIKIINIGAVWQFNNFCLQPRVQQKVILKSSLVELSHKPNNLELNTCDRENNTNTFIN